MFFKKHRNEKNSTEENRESQTPGVPEKGPGDALSGIPEEIRAFAESGTPALFDRLAAQYGPEALMLQLMRAYPSLPDQARLADRIRGAACLDRAPREIRTVGVFYYRISRGGTERVLCDLLRMWDRLGYRTVLFTDHPATPEDEPVPAGTKRILLPDTFALTADTRASRFRTLRHAIEAERIDCFIHHAWLSRNLLWDLLAVRSRGIPFAVYTHSSPSCLFMDEDPANMDELPHLARIFRLTDHVICLSRTFEAFWRHYAPRTSLLLNPCATPDSGAAKAAFPRDGAPLLLWAGRFAPEKQPAEALRILSRVRRSIPGARLALLGSGGEAYRDLEHSLREQIRDEGLEGAVEMPGFVADPAPWYKQASVLLLTSQYEGFSLVIAEAKTYGVPAVIYDLPYLYFAEEPRGLLAVPQGNAAAAAAAVVSLLTDESAWQRASDEALAGSAAFSPETLSAAWKALFRSLEGGAEPAPAARTDPDTAALDMLLSQLHFGLKNAQKKETDRQRDAAGGLLNSIFDATYYAARYPDLRTAFGTDEYALLRHYLDTGMAEGRQASPLFDPKAYAARYPDLRAAFGSDWRSLAMHFLLHGRGEHRRGN